MGLPQQMVAALMSLRIDIRCLCVPAPLPSIPCLAPVHGGRLGIAQSPCTSQNMAGSAQPTRHAQLKNMPHLLPIAGLCHSPLEIKDLGEGRRQSPNDQPAKR